MADFRGRFNELSEQYVGTDAELGSALGVSKQTISAWRTGTRSPKKPHIVKIANYFNVSIPWLMGITDHDDGQPDLPVELDDDETRLLSIYRDLNQKGKSALMKQADYLMGDPEMKKDGQSSIETA